MADNKDVDSGEESDGRNGSPNSIVSELNSTYQTAAEIPEESGVEGGAESGHENQSSSSTNQTSDHLSSNSESGSGPDQEATVSLADVIFKIRRRLNLLKGSSRNAPSDDHEQSTTPKGPASRNLPPDCVCFMKKLTLTDASHDDGKLDIEPFKAVWIPKCPQIPKEAHDTRKSVELMVFDYENTQYNMVLTGYNYEGIVLYSINGEWGKFIRAHNLQHGDRIVFYKNRDPRINLDDFYYIILFTRKSDGDFIFEDDSGEDEGKKE